jgi:hypothetical protein
MVQTIPGFDDDLIIEAYGIPFFSPEGDDIYS